MQKELDAMNLTMDVQILGLNQTGHQSQNATACNGKDIPWLQDVPAQDVWSKWAINFRDVIILDEGNQVVGTYNLTEHNLTEAAKYETLRNMLIDFAGGIQAP